MSREIFILYYRGLNEDDFIEDYKIFKTLKRSLSSYIKNPSLDKLHLIYNKILILSRSFSNSFIFWQIELNSDEDSKTLVHYILKECFNTEHNPKYVDEVWEDHLIELIDTNKVIKGEKI